MLVKFLKIIQFTINYKQLSDIASQEHILWMKGHITARHFENDISQQAWKGHMIFLEMHQNLM